MPGSAPAGERYRILWVTPEVEGLAGTGPAARGSFWLPRTLAALGHQVRVVLPRCRATPRGRTLGDFPVVLGGRRLTAIVRALRPTVRDRRGRRRALPVFLLDNYEFFDREEPAGYPDDGERFSFFCRAVADLVQRARWQVDVLHLHDWPTGPLALLARQLPGACDRRLACACVFTFYLAQRQGRFGRETLALLGLPDSLFHPDALELYGQVSFLKAGLLYADALATVSRAYARQIQEAPHGHGLEGLFRVLAGRLTGVVHGIDAESCDPARDRSLYRPFSADQLGSRTHNKVALLQDLGLSADGIVAAPSVPLAAYVGELTHRRGARLLLDALPGLMERRVRVVVLGCGEPDLERSFQQAAQTYPGQLGVVLGFNPVRIRRTYAGADMVLVPALEKPEITGHLMAMRYGAVPVVRAQGSLADTVLDFETGTGMGNGFVFRGTAPEDFLHAVDRALDVFRHPQHWQNLVRNCMGFDGSWLRTAVEYTGLYAQAMAQARARPQPGLESPHGHPAGPPAAVGPSTRLYRDGGRH
ncbi:MAG TPA: glycogen/starch synthase [Limnochordales bacterium]